MNKKQILILSITLTILTGSSIQVFAQEPLQPTLFITITPTPTPQQIDYTLPYPGILPDNPLYFLKAARDKMISIFISSPFKKAEFDLLQADKRLNMGVYLESTHKPQFISSTISKGENYFEEGIGQLQEAKIEKIDIKNETRTYSTASQKHIEILTQLEKQVSSSVKKDLQHEQNRVKEFQKRIKQIEK